MTKHKGRRKTKPDDVEDDDLYDDAHPEPIESLLEELGAGEYRITVYKFEDNTGWKRVYDYPADQFSHNMLVDTYGGGKYRLRIFDTHGRYIKQTEITYAEPKKRIDSIPPTEIKNESQKEMINLLRDQLTSSKEETKSTMAQMMIMITKVMEIQMSQNANRKEVNVLDEVEKLKNLLYTSKNPMQDISSVIDLLKTGMGMGKEVASASGSDSAEDMVVKKLIDTFLPAIANNPALLQKLSGMGKSIPPTTPAIQTFIPPVIPQVINNGEIKMKYRTESERIVIETLKDNLPALLNCAKISADYNIVINVLDTKLSEPDLNRVLDYYGIDGNFERTLELIPEFKMKETYFRGLIDAINKAFVVEENNNETGTDGEDKDKQPDASDSAPSN